MRKLIGLLLSVLCICCAAIGLTGCKKDKHIHAFDKQVITDEYKATDTTCTEAATYFYSCSCGEKGTETFAYGESLGHSLSEWKIQKKATETEKGLKTRNCTRNGCNYSESENIPMLSHTQKLPQKNIWRQRQPVPKKRNTTTLVRAAKKVRKRLNMAKP